MIAVDAHAHLRPCFDVRTFLQAAHRNLSEGVGRESSSGGEPTCVLFVLSTPAGKGVRRLEQASSRWAEEGPDVWSVKDTEEEISMWMTSGGGEQKMAIISGWQIVSQENLEVLALGTRQQFESGAPARTLLQKIARAGALPVLPWGVGKWWGRRGRVVRRLIEDESLPLFFLGDNANRPALWPRPSLFRRAEERGLKVLPGSDPLPFPTEIQQVGRFGGALQGELDLLKPAQDLKDKLLDPSVELYPFGHLETPLRFLRNQFKMQLRT